MAKIKMNSAIRIQRRLGIEPYGPAHKFMAQRCKDRMNSKYVPEDKGILIDTSFVNNNCAIVYPAPYAQFLYYGKVMIGEESKSAYAKKGERKIVTNKDLYYSKSSSGPYWDKRMMSAEKKELIKEVNNYVKRGVK